MKVERILIPTDFSENSLAALKFASHFVDRFDTVVDLIHVIPIDAYFSVGFEGMTVPIDFQKDVYPKVMEKAQEEMERLASIYLRKGYRGDMIVSIGSNVYRAIMNQTEEQDYDLILMSRKGANESHFLRGSSAEKVIRHSDVPVLTLDDDAFEKEFSNIVVPLDMSDISYSGIPLAFILAKEFDAQLTFHHVIEMYSTGIEGMAFVGPYSSREVAYASILNKLKEFFNDNPEMGLSFEQKASQNEGMLTWAKDAESVSIPVFIVVEEGVAAHHQIIDYANEHADLLVMTTHGRTGLAKFFLGSTASQVVQHVHKPMLTVKPNGLK